MSSYTGHELKQDESFSESVDREPAKSDENNNKHKWKFHDDPAPNLIDETGRHMGKALPAQ